jgi:hypothetical protein
MSYTAVIAKIHTRPLLGADKLVIGDVLGYSVIVGIDTPQDALGIFFEAGGQLSDEFCKANNLYRVKDADGKDIGGMFEENRRVKCIKLRGAKSEGFWIPIQSLSFTGYTIDGLKEGDSFDMFGDVPICRKYETEHQRKKGQTNNVGVKIRKNNPMFVKHYETSAFKKFGVNIPAGAYIMLSEKVHGTSQRTGVVLDSIPNVGWRKVAERILGWFGVDFLENQEWVKLNGTRNTVVEKRKGEGFHGAEGFRLTCGDTITPRKGELFFYEIVGFTENGAAIMHEQDTSVLKSKAFTKKYGAKMTYKYGCPEGQCAVYVYRIASVNVDGQLTEYSWPMVVARCKELGLKTVPVLEPPFIYDGDYAALQERVSAHVEGTNLDEVMMSTLDPFTVREGVVVRYEHEDGFGWLKQKSFAFFAMEGLERDNPYFVDREEAS